MAIKFAPKRGAILMCDFGRANVPPEMNKVRPVVVVSLTRFNHRHGTSAGHCTVAPFSATEPDPSSADVFIPSGRYWSLTKDSWVRCRMISTVSHERLDLVLRGGRRIPNEFMNADDLALVETAARQVLGIR